MHDIHTASFSRPIAHLAELPTALQTSTQLDVGCGPHCLPGAVGLDFMAAPGVAVVHDVNQAPWPIESGKYTFIRCQHAIEHFREVHTVAKEMYRVAKNGARIDFITPHYSSYASWGDPTHVHHFALASLPLLFDQAVGKGHYRVLKNEIKFTGAVIEVLGWLIYKFSPKKYEKHFAWIFPASEIHTSIEIIKP
jgi:SAM-dependent methyltransferase